MIEVRRIAGLFNEDTGAMTGLAATDPGPSRVVPLDPLMIGKTISTGGRRAAFIGGSHHAQCFPAHDLKMGTYQRVNGVASAQTSLPLYRARHQRFTVAIPRLPEVEGDFKLKFTTTVGGTGHLWTWDDPRPDIALGSESGLAGLLEAQAWNVGQAWIAYMQAALGNPHQVVMFGIPGGGLDNWLEPVRIQRIAAAGPYDEIFANFMGNQVLGTDDPTDLMMDKLVDILRQLSPLCRLLTVVLPPSIRGVGLTSPKWTRGSLIVQKMLRTIPSLFPNAVVVSGTLLNESSWSPHDVATPEDVQQGWPAAADMQDDEVHLAHGMAFSWGMGMAAMHGAPVPLTYPGVGRMSDNRLDALQLDGSEPVTNAIRGLYGQITTQVIGGGGTSGTAPANGTVGWVNRNTAQVVSSLEPHPAGGSRWVLRVTDSASSPQGGELTMTLNLPELVAILNANQGQPAQLQLPIAASGWAEGSIVSVTAGLFAVVDGVEIPVAEVLADRGQNIQADPDIERGRTLGPGFNLTLKSPGVNLPGGTTTSCLLRFQVKQTPISRGPVCGGYTLALGPDFRLDITPAAQYFDKV